MNFLVETKLRKAVQQGSPCSLIEKITGTVNALPNLRNLNRGRNFLTYAYIPIYIYLNLN